MALDSRDAPDHGQTVSATGSYPIAGNEGLRV